MSRNNPLTRTKHKLAREQFDARRYEEARRLYQQICGKDRIDDYAWTMLGITQALLNDLDEAENCLLKAVGLNKDNFDALYNLGRALYGKGLFDQALGYYQKALMLRPDHVDTLIGLGLSSSGLGQWVQAQNYYERVLAASPGHAAALDNLANVLRNQGQPELAIPYYRQASIASPRSTTWSNYLLCLHYPASHDPQMIFQEHRAWGEAQARGYTAPPFREIERDPARKLRIGYVTPDLRCHSVAYFIEPLLLNHDREQFEVFSYLELGEADHMTQRLLEHAGTVRNTGGMADDQVVAMIRSDHIDILVDLAGHTSNNRLQVFSRKPAPIQVTYLGYPNTTGLLSMDYRLTDKWADPPGVADSLHTEKLLRLEGGFLCFAPPAESVGVSPPPFSERGFVTFGSFNALPKITTELLAVWARILSDVPSSRLLIKNAQLTDPDVVARIRKQFVQLGIEEDRIEMLGRTSKEEHMAAFGRVDIALDSFPYHGTTTTCDTLWMGVPVITLAGQSHVSRVGVSLLSRMGLSEYVAQSHDEYIEKAVRLANSGTELERLRKNMRKVFADCGLCDGGAFTRTVERVFRECWQEWCAKPVNEVNEVFQGNGDNALAHLKSGWIAQSKKQWDLALKAFQKALNLAPDNLEALYGLGAVYGEQGHYAMAIEYFRKVQALAPDNEQIGFHIARLEGLSPAAPPVDYVRRLFDDYADRFDAHLVGELSYKGPELIRAAVMKVLGPANRQMDILDLGCGTGLCAPLFRKWASSLSGIDLSEKMIEAASRRGLYDRLTVGDIAVALEGVSEAHDLIIAADVFIYVGDLKRVFELCSVALKRSGVFAFTVEAARDEAADFVLEPSGRYSHSRRYLSELGRSHGLEMDLIEEGVLRTDRGNPIQGFTVVLRKP